MLSQRQAYSTYNGGGLFGLDYNPPNAAVILKFNDDTLEQIIEPVNMHLSVFYSRAAYSDTNGNLLFASNGWRLVNREGEVLSYKLWDQSMPHPGNSADSTAILVMNGPLFLDDPANPDRAFLLYGQHKSLVFPNFSGTYDMTFSYAYLDVPNKALISQNNTIPIDTSALGDMVATRHANGRDWWIIKPGLLHNKYYIGLLDPTGFNFEEITIPGLTPSRQANTTSQFSFDGSRYVHFTQAPLRQIHVYDFDRCSGTLSNLIVHDISDSLVQGDINPISLSPDGTKIYLKRANSNIPPLNAGLFQFDLNIGQFTYFIAQHATYATLAPNGKTMVFSSDIINQNGVPLERFVSEIMHPNLSGEACNAQIHKYPVSNKLAMVMPSNYANFKLGALEGSGCDTLSLITRLVSKTVKIKAFPNPFHETLMIETDGLLPAQLTVRNMLGQVVLEEQLNLVQTQLNDHWADLPAGMYSLEVKNRQQNTSIIKVLKE